MTVTAFLSGLFAIFKAIPSIKGWWDQLIAAYIKHQKEKLSQEITDAIKELSLGNQIPIEETIGYSEAGEVSHRPGAVVVDSLPGVVRKQKED